MAKLLPFKPELPSRDQQPRLVDLDDETADEVFAALSSATARNIVSELYTEPATASDVADAVDTSLQNARYHLDKLQAAGVIEPVDTWYSSRGTEMTVYAPTNEPLVVAAGKEESTSVLREALTRMLSAVAILGILSVLVDRWARSVLTRAVRRTADAAGGSELLSEEAATATPEADGGDAGGGGGDGGAGGGDGGGAMGAMDAENTTTPSPTSTAEPGLNAADVTSTPTEAAATPSPAPTPSPTSTPEPTQLVQETAATQMTTDAAAGMNPGLIGGVPPGALFFAGGLVVIALVAGWWYLTRFRPMYG